MQDYLRRHCDCHPLVIGIVAGLVNDYLPSRGDFDAWAADPDHGGRLDLADVGLAMKRNRILTAALDSLSETSRQLLLTLALLPQASDYAALEALNPHRPPEPAVPPEPTTSSDWKFLNDVQRVQARARYAAAMRSRLQWETRDHAAEKAALARTVRDLEQRGLMQYDKFALRYDLHPVVRAVASGGLRDADRDRLGQRVVDHFSTRRGNRHELAQSLDDLRPELTVVHTLLRMGRLMEAFEAYADELGVALLFNLEAYTEVVSLLRPFFGSTWTSPAAGIPAPVFAYLGSHAASAFQSGVDPATALAIYTATLPGSLARKDWMSAIRLVFNIGITYQSTNRLASADGCLRLAYRLADALGDRGQLFWGRSNLMDFATTTGRWAEADELWRDLDPMGRQWSRTIYRPGDVECSHVSLQYRRGRLTETELAAAEALSRDGLNRGGVRSLHNLRGRWMLDRGHYAAAAESLREALRMERETTLHAPDSEAWLALASVHLGQSPAARDVATRLSGQTRPPHLALSELWHALGDREQATTHALAAYEWAWADGEPYVRRFELNRSAALLKTLGVEPPVLPPYDPTRERETPWEADVNKAIEELQRGREADT
jgi:tetratricopeptide (TPR) repeat protein